MLPKLLASFRSTSQVCILVSFYDESLKKQVEGSYVSDGKSIHVSSAYGAKSVPYTDLGASIDHNAQVLLVQKLGRRCLRILVKRSTLLRARRILECRSSPSA